MLSENVMEKSVAKKTEADTHHVPNAEEISLETVINLLVKKGVLSADELFSLEDQMREYRQYKNDVKYMKIKNNYDRGRFPKLKKSMSKRKWSRRLGSMLFGWKWKKVKKSQTYY